MRQLNIMDTVFTDRRTETIKFVSLFLSEKSVFACLLAFLLYRTVHVAKTDMSGKQNRKQRGFSFQYRYPKFI
jgi:hypothetical protein